MKGEMGICQVGLGSSSIRRTKYDTEINCMDALKSLKALGVISQNSVVYKCNSCSMWHIEKR